MKKKKHVDIQALTLLKLNTCKTCISLLHFIIFPNLKTTEWCMKWSSIWSNNKFFISITILESKIQKERPLYGDLSSVNEVFNMTTIMSGNFFNTNCDAVDYSIAHTLSYLVADLTD
jgi:hypothetical protein